MRIGIIGCGWLGRPLARNLSKTFQVECNVRKKNIQTQTEFNYVCDPEAGHSFWSNDILIIAISTKEDYLPSLEKAARLAADSSHIILMSSTSVYREFDTEIDEKALITHKSLQKEAEELILGLREKVLILRLGGLMGQDRISGKWKSCSSFADGPVNYIHQDDVISIVRRLIEEKVQSGIFNLVAPKHPLRSQIHQKNSRQFGFLCGSFEGRTNRIVHAHALEETLDYTFMHPDPLYFWE